MILNALFCPFLPKNSPGPARLISRMASATVAYCICVFSEAIPSFIELPFGKDKCL